LILLDAALVLFMAMSVFCYVKFHQQRYKEFSKQWWFWLLATGASLAATLGCKMVGLFTFMTVGAAVLWDLWGIMDIKRGHTMVSLSHKTFTYIQQHVQKHFFYRVVGLILWPFLIYLSFFWVHFKILKFSGPGDSFMSPAFQVEIRYFDTVSIRHKDTKQLLHSHPEYYPLRYDDGRISSQGRSDCSVTLTLRPAGYLLSTQ
jgi:dolichyl-phosphate-mannose-protein mannosyltransferase